MGASAMSMPPLPPGFELIQDPAPSAAGGFPPPPAGFELLDAAPVDAGPQIDFNRPIDAVRSDIGKLQGPARAQALKAWADHVVAQEAKPLPAPQSDIEPPSIGMGRLARQKPTQTVNLQAPSNAVRAVSRGSFVGPFLDEISAGTAAAQNALGLGGAPYDEAVAYQRARDNAYDTANPGASLALKLAGGVAGGVGAMRQGGVTAGGALVGGPFATAAPAATLMGNVGKGAGIGAVYGGVAGAGNAEEGQRISEGIDGAKVGALVGGALPPVVAGASKIASAVSDAVSPQVARLSQGTRNVLEAAGVIQPEAQGFNAAGAAGAPRIPRPPITGAEAAAERVIANDLTRSNVSMTDIRQRRAQARTAGNNADATALVDLDNSMQRLGSTVARQQPEAGNRARNFLYGRQTGETPVDGMPNATGIPTRPAMTPEVPNQPMGQYERVRTVLRDALEIPARSARQAEGDLAGELERNARPLYRQTYQAAQGVDMEPVVGPLVQQWRTLAADQVDPLVARQLNAAVGNVERALRGGNASHFERLNAAKISIDEMIDRSMRSQDRRSPNLARMLTGIKGELVDAMDNVPNIGPMYRNARQTFGNNREMQDAIELGRAAFREGAEVTAEQYAALTAGQQRMFRLGLYESFEQNMGGRGRTRDVTQVFESPRIQEILQAVIPNANTPQQVGRALQTEKGFIATRNEVLGNSKTAQRLADDETYNRMAGLFEQLRSTKSISDAALRLTQATIDRVFGFRADVAAEVSRKLFTADYNEMEQLFRRLDDLMGPNRAAQFRTLMEQNHARLMQAASTMAQGQQQQGGRRTPPPSPPQNPNARPMPRPPSRPTQP